MKKLFSLIFLISSVSLGNGILFPNYKDFTISSSSWACEVVGLNFKNSCIYKTNYILKNIKVGFLDTGFNGRLSIFSSFNISSGYDVKSRTSEVKDVVGHGTQVVSVFIDTMNLIESLTHENIPFEIIPIKVVDDYGTIDSYQIIRGYFYLSSYLNVEIINMSLTGSDYSQDEHQAFQYGSKRSKSLLVVASGNELYNLDRFNSYPCSYQTENMLCVGGMNKNNDLVSNFGFDVDTLTHGDKVRVVNNDGSYNQKKGSSYSAPQISAYATYALFKNPNLNFTQIKDMIIESSQNKDFCLYSKSCGMFDFNKFKALVDKSYLN